MEPLTKRQQQVLDYIHTCQQENGIPPSMREDEIPCVPPLPATLRSLVKVWAYCKQRFRVTQTVPAPVKRQMTLGFAVAPKKPRT